MSNKEKVEFDMREIADAICKGHLAQYAQPGELKADKANKYGIVVQFSPSTKRIRFQFLLRDIENALVDMQVDAAAFIVAPRATLGKLHQEIHTEMEKFHKARSQIVIPTSLEKKLLAEAVHETRH